MDAANALPVAEAAGIRAESFFVASHRLVWEAIAELASAPGAPIDWLAVSDRLSARGVLDAAGGHTGIMQIADGSPTAAHAEYYAALVADAALRRAIIAASGESAAAAYDPDREAGAVLADAEGRLYALSPDAGKRRKSWRDACAESAALEEASRLAPNGVMGLATGFADLDHKLKGLHPGEMIVLAARPSMGKTALAMNIAENVAARGVPVAVFSLEMSPVALADRMIRSHAGSLRADALARAAGEVASYPIWIDNTPGMEAPAVLSLARRAKQKHGAGLVVVDYLQLLNWQKYARENRQRETAAISQLLKRTAVELAVPVLVLSQLSRNPELREKNAIPRLSDLRDSGAIEQDADVVMLLRRPCKYPSDKRASDERLAIVDVAKHRNGATGEVELDFDGFCTRFSTRAAAEPAEESPAYYF